MRQSRHGRLALIVILMLSLLLAFAPSAQAAGRPKVQTLTYSYDNGAGTFTLYTTTASGGVTYFTQATLQVDGGAVRADALCFMNAWIGGGDSTCVFSNVPTVNDTIVATAVLDLLPGGSDTATYVGDFNDTCRQVSTKGCTGEKAVRLTVPR